MKDIVRKYTPETEKLVENFEKLHQERVQAYKLFENGHKDYMNTSPNYDFIGYRQVVHNVTQMFKRISENILVIEEELRANMVTDIANLISTIQDCEKKKLQMTVEHQLARQMVADVDDSEMCKQKEKEIALEISEIMEEINDNISEVRCLICDV